MWIKLLRPHACFYPPRIEPPGSIVSIGGPRGAALIAAGIAEAAAQPPEVSEADIGVRDFHHGGNISLNSQFSSPEPRSRDGLSAEAAALVAALSSRRARRRRIPAKPTGAFDADRG